MSFNDFMHPRNPFKIKPNYQLLADKYPSFKDFLIPYSLNKKFKINFEDPNALRCLSTILLKDKFSLEVNIPLNRLIPSVPQRCNYILWLEDLINLDTTNYNLESNINLIDIGTGASCIFPLVSTKLNENCNFLATELDDYSLECARKNVETNKLSDRIKVIKGNSNQLIPDLIDDYQSEFAALMCNPPFFEIRNQDTGQLASNTSILAESTIEGGEESFVSKLMEESFLKKNQIKLFTVMLGRKSSLKNLKRKLKEFKNDNILNYCDAEFCQGRTIRWGLCWTFDLSLKLNSIKLKHSSKSTPIFELKIPTTKFIYTYNLNRITEHILDQLDNIMIDKSQISNLTKSKNKIQFTIKTNLNTWSNQRRKRRQKMREDLNKVGSSCENDDEIINEDSNNSVRKKRLIDELELSLDDLEPPMLDNEEKFKKLKTKDEDKNDEEFYLLNCIIKIEQIKDEIYLKMKANRNIKDKESVHQLFQFLKNNLI